jgi:hypothetical protein
VLLPGHRLEDARGIRRHKIHHSAMASIVSIGKAEDPRRMSYAPARMRQYDHSPHDVRSVIKLQNIASANKYNFGILVKKIAEILPSVQQ